MAAVYQLKIRFVQDKFGAVLWQTKSAASFPLEDKHVVNEHHVIRKGLDATRKICPHVVYSMYHVTGFKQTLMYKVKNGLVPQYISELFDVPHKGYNLRNADFNIPRFRTVRYGKHSLRYLGPLLWSKLIPLDRESPTLNCFKHNIKKKELTLLLEDCRNCDLCF